MYILVLLYWPSFGLIFVPIFLLRDFSTKLVTRWHTRYSAGRERERRVGQWPQYTDRERGVGVSKGYRAR
jgi:hypothetical protein